MSKYSDHNKPQFDITKYLPEVYRSDVNNSLFNMAFNRHFTKDDSQRVAGIIGKSAPNALVKRQIIEQTPHRQAYQLAPTMYSKIGTIETSLSYKAFLQQLELMGVSASRLPLWANSVKFNWVPPINLDMFINYQDYFWNPTAQGEEAQYFTVENRCPKLQSKLASYDTMLESRGTSFPVTKIDVANNQLILDGRLNDLFTNGFVFFTTDTTNVNLSEHFWTVDAVSFDETLQQTRITLVESIAIVGEAEPTTADVGRWWFNPITKSLRQWNGATWIGATSAVAVSISLSELRAIYQSETNCACAGDLGWDMAPWDDNQIGTILWDQDLFSSVAEPNPPRRIDFASEDEWLSWNTLNPQSPAVVSANTPVSLALWYDTTNDQLKQYAAVNGTNPADSNWISKWIVVVNNFSSLRSSVTGLDRWDQTIGCEPQVLNSWSASNRWIHKTQVKSFGGVKRAQLPILEYNSGLELNQWTRVTRTWKFRAEPGQTFDASTQSPTRLELEPIKGYVVSYVNDVWYVYLFGKDVTTCRDVNYTSTFAPGFQFKVVDDTARADTYTVQSSEFREITSAEPSVVTDVTGTGVMCTVVRLVETDFVSAVQGGGSTHFRIEPRVTSKGTPWRGYHIHWMLDDSTVNFSPETNQSLNVYRTLDQQSEPTVELVKGNTAYTSVQFQPSLQTEIELGTTYQEMILSIPNVRTIDLAPKFHCDGTGSRLFALPGTNELRVYVNGVRQYGNYSERTAIATPDYTLVGSVGQSSAQITYVVGIDFDRPLGALDTVRMEVGPAAYVDMGMFAVPVRTIEDEEAFAQQVADGTQPVYISLTSVTLLEQAKVKANQYPLFNVYDVITGDVLAANEIFRYKEDSSAGVNAILQRRVALGNSNTDFVFEQTLIDQDNGIIYGYRDTSMLQSYWYNPTTNKVLYWDGEGWTNDVQMQVGGVVVYRTPVVVDSEPTELNSTDQSLWFDPRQNSLFRRDISSSRWTQLGVTVSTTDPSLRTIWRRGKNDETVQPQYVDKDGNIVAVGSSSGDWGIVDQWIYNPLHYNKKALRFTELFTHFNKIVTAQPNTPGLQGGGVYALSQADYNYGLGGTIKEYNDCFDTLISAVNVTNITPTGVVSFAADEYAAALLQVKDTFSKFGSSILSSYSTSSILDLSQYVAANLILMYENNDQYARIYGDTSAYDEDTHIGVKNWVSTAPMFRFVNAVSPHINMTGQFVELVHHDGHRTTITLTAGEIDKIARALCNSIDPRSGTPLGKISSSSVPTTVDTMTTQLGGTRSGAYWYYQSNGVRKLYRFEMLSAGSIAPALTVDGLTIPDGTMYYNISTKATYAHTNGDWIPITNIGAADISPLWREIDLSVLLAEALLEIENRLYDITPDTPLVVDIASLTSGDDALLQTLRSERFAEYTQSREISAPLVNVDYTAADPFTWNYISAIVETAPRDDFDGGTASCWQQLYTQWYGTPYPHLEPWKLQGYTSKPTWWDDNYLDNTGVRRWIYNHTTRTGMWENIRVGLVPEGFLLPDGITVSTGLPGQTPLYNYFCVNISDAAMGTYPVDSVLPPYFVGSSQTDGTLRSIFTDYFTQISTPDADYAFGDGSLIEWQWTSSIDYIYDQLIIAFMMQPLRFMRATFGPEFVTVDGLQLDAASKQVYSVTDAMFHGDIHQTNQMYTSRGLNQWYVNFNRQSGFDTNGDFRQLWAGWMPTMTYQFGGIIDTSTFEIANKYFDIVPHDYNVLLVNNGVIKDLWMDAFEVSLINIPPPIQQYNNQSAWKMDIDSLASSSRPISYYGVKEYSQTPDPVLTKPIDIASTTTTGFVLPGNVVAQFPPEVEFDVTESDNNNGTYTVRDSFYDSVLNQTHVLVIEQL